MDANGIRTLSVGVAAALLAACGGANVTLYSAPGAGALTLTLLYRTAKDDYVRTLGYVLSSTANGRDDSGNAINGYQWWNFAYPTLVMSGANTRANFIPATDGSVNFGGPAGAAPARNATLSEAGFAHPRHSDKRSARRGSRC